MRKQYRSFIAVLAVFVASLGLTSMASAANVVNGIHDAWSSSVSPTYNHGDAEWRYIDANAPTDSAGKGVPSAYTWIQFPTSGLDKTKTYSTVSVDAFTWYGGQKVTLDQVAAFNYSTVTWNTQPSALVTGLATYSQPTASTCCSNREHYTFATSSVLDGSGNFPTYLYFRLRLTKGTAQEMYVGSGFNAEGVCKDELGTTNNPVTDPAYVNGACFDYAGG